MYRTKLIKFVVSTLKRYQFATHEGQDCNMLICRQPIIHVEMYGISYILKWGTALVINEDFDIN